MKKVLHIVLSAVLLASLSAVSCRQEIVVAPPELVVSLYIPGTTMTKGETGPVNPIQEELKLTSLQVWVFLSEDRVINNQTFEAGTLVCYKSFNSELENTGLPNGVISRFGLPLRDEMFDLLTDGPSPDNRPKVDVYAVANVASAVEASQIPGENTTQQELDNLIVTGFGGETTSLTIGVPANGLPMSGVNKGAPVTGVYPVLNVSSISSVKLTRAVSKIRFVFSQQGTPADGETPAVPVNNACKIIGISFDGTANDCQIGASERLFTEQSFDLGSTPAYSPLSASLGGNVNNPLLPNNKLSVLEEPGDLYFRGFGHETETAEEYETRLNAAIAADSQIGPIYLRETNKTISGTITYQTDNVEVQSVEFSLTDVFSRNHTWIVYAYFVEETKKLHLTTSVLSWEKTNYAVDYTSGSINVVRRFTVFDNPSPTFRKVRKGDFYDVRFWHTLNNQENVITGDIIIATPVGGILYAIPVEGSLGGTEIENQDVPLFLVEPQSAEIYPQHLPDGRVEDCRITITIKCNPAAIQKYSADQLEKKYIDLHFSVYFQGMYIDLGSESLDHFRFVLKQNWEEKEPGDPDYVTPAP